MNHQAHFGVHGYNLRHYPTQQTYEKLEVDHSRSCISRRHHYSKTQVTTSKRTTCSPTVYQSPSCAIETLLDVIGVAFGEVGVEATVAGTTTRRVRARGNL